MKRFIKYANLFLCLLLTLTMATATLAAKESKEKTKQDNKPPIGCRNMGYKQEWTVLILNPDDAFKQQTIYFLFNKYPKTVNLYHMRNGDSLNGYYFNHSVNPQQWAIFAMDEPEMKFICTTPSSKSKYGDIIDCAQAFTVCQYNNVIFGLNNRGNFWIGNNYSRSGAVMDVVRYGIIPAI